jgi:hypothetical protein
MTITSSDEVDFFSSDIKNLEDEINDVNQKAVMEEATTTIFGVDANQKVTKLEAISFGSSPVTLSLLKEVYQPLLSDEGEFPISIRTQIVDFIMNIKNNVEYSKWYDALPRNVRIGQKSTNITMVLEFLSTSSEELEKMGVKVKHGSLADVYRLRTFLDDLYERAESDPNLVTIKAFRGAKLLRDKEGQPEDQQRNLESASLAETLESLYGINSAASAKAARKITKVAYELGGARANKLNAWFSDGGGLSEIIAAGGGLNRMQGDVNEFFDTFDNFTFEQLMGF